MEEAEEYKINTEKQLNEFNNICKKIERENYEKSIIIEKEKKLREEDQVKGGQTINYLNNELINVKREFEDQINKYNDLEDKYYKESNELKDQIEKKYIEIMEVKRESGNFIAQWLGLLGEKEPLMLNT